MDMYEKIEIEIEYIGNDDVITTSSEHDNAYLSFDDLLDFIEEFDDTEDTSDTMDTTNTVNMDSLINSEILE